MNRLTRQHRLVDAMLIASLSALAPVTSLATVHTALPVMLANNYDAGSVELAEYWVSEKYDGVRARWTGTELLTRNGHAIHAPGWFTSGWPSLPMDGELWIGRGRFESVSGIVRRESPNDAAWRTVRFMVFDLPAHAGPFDVRLKVLEASIASLGQPWVQPVEQFRMLDHASLTARLEAVVRAGGEGLMLHRGASAYTADRSDDLLKLKPYEDAEAQIVDYLPGRGKYAGMVGALRVRSPDGLEFNIGTGLTDEQRRRAPPLGTWITYGYHGLTAKGVPRFARFIRERTDMSP